MATAASSHPVFDGARGRRRDVRGVAHAASVAFRLLGAVLVAVSAAIHLHLWSDGYRNIPTIGRLFLAQGVVGLVLVVALAASGRAIVVAAGIGYMLASIGALVVSDVHGLFGLHDTLAVPYAMSSLVVEIVGAGALVAAVAVGSFARPVRLQRP
jgi:hypothetical protein